MLEWARSGACGRRHRARAGEDTDRAGETAVSEQHDEESLRRWAREQAEIERQTDALVLRTLTAMVTAAEDLKSKLRRDTETILEEFRRSKRGLEERDLALGGRAPAGPS